ncbi:MAG: hypothetical protein HKL90_05220 [Elusimicrobia bacterium]|nr:hypothetical protein [Elusimicrobiota bacterium]
MNEFWKERSPRERLIFCVCAAVAAVFLVTQGVLRPYNDLLESRQSQIAAKELRLARAKRWAAANGARSKRDEAFARLRADGDGPAAMSRLLANVEAVARTSAVRITNLQPLPIRDSGARRECAVDLQVEASLEGLTRFLYGLQTSPSFLSVPRFSLTSAPAAAGGPRLRLSMTVARALSPAAAALPSSENAP